MRNRVLSLFVISLLAVLPLFVVACGSGGQPELEYSFSGKYFTIGYESGFTTAQTENGAVIKGKPFSINISSKPYAGASLGDLSSIKSEVEVVKSGLTDYEEETLKIEDTEGILVSGIANGKRGIVWFIPVDLFMISVFTEEPPNSKTDFELAQRMIKSFRLTNPDYLSQQTHEVIPDPDDSGENNNNNDNDSHENDNTTDNGAGDTTPTTDNPEQLSNEYIQMTIPSGWELTSDDSRLTIIEPKTGNSSDTLSFSIQYVDLGKEMKMHEFVSSIAEQTGGTQEKKRLGANSFQVIKSKHDNYTEFHLIAERLEGLPLMISLITPKSELPDDAIKIIETIKIK